MMRSLLISMLGSLFRLVEWPIVAFCGHSRTKAQTIELAAKGGDLDDYRVQMDQTKCLLSLRRDVLLPLIEGLKDAKASPDQTSERIDALTVALASLRQGTTHAVIASVSLVLPEGESLDYRSVAGIQRLHALRDAIDDAERATSALRQELRKRYPGSPLLMGTSEVPVT